MNFRSFIPNLFTCLNLAFGCLAIIEIFEGHLENVIYYTLLSGFVDFLDGFLARILKSPSTIGADLDSLADMVSFGVVPTFVFYSMMKGANASSFFLLLPLLTAVISALRLAIFNNDDRQTDVFIGMPTPANAFLVISLPLLAANGIWTDVLQNQYALAGLIVVTSILLIIEVPMLALKFKDFGLKANWLKYSFLLVSLGAILVHQLLAIPFIIGIYTIGSILVRVFSYINSKKGQ